MNIIIEQLKYKLKNGSVVEQLIFVNIFVFILTYFLGGVGSLFNNPQNFLYTWFALPANIDDYLDKPWTLITYGFMHGGFPHLLFNLITLYFIGNLFTDFFTPKKLLSFYLMGTILGGIVFLISYSYFPALQQQNSTLVGASSGISATLIGLTTYIPNYEIKFRFIGFVKLLFLGLIFIAWDLISLGGNNTGGHLAHLGGATYGFFAIYYRNSFRFKNVFKKEKKNPKSSLKTSYKSTNKQSTRTNTNETQQKIDAILDKISKSGYEALSKAEKDFLFQQGKK